MRTTGGTACVCSHQSANNCISAMESPPPETASAARAFGGKPSRLRARENRAVRSRFAPGTLLAAFVVGALDTRPGRDGRRGVGIFCGERDKGGTAFFHLTEFEQRQAEFQHAFGGTLCLRIFFQQLGEIACRLWAILFLRKGVVARPI